MRDRPRWGRPQHLLGEPVPLRVLLARSPTAAVQVQHFTAFPLGFEFQVVAHFAPAGPVWDPMHGLAGLRGRPHTCELSDEHLRLRIEFADGSHADNLGPPMLERMGPAPALQPGSGGASESMAEVTFWVSPLPPPGPIILICEWPKYGIPPTRQEIDGALIVEAASRAVELWPEGDQREA